RLGFSADQVARASACALAVSMLASLAGESRAQPPPAGTAAPVVSYASQGWSAADRDTFYTTSQGSHMMPYAWFKSLRRLDIDELFAADELQRYGYLHNDRADSPYGLPIGFVIDGNEATGQVGLTCAACHTGQ